jgi:hypothetical protein
MTGTRPWEFHANAKCPAAGTTVADQPAEKLIKIGIKVVRRGRYVTLEMPDAKVKRQI